MTERHWEKVYTEKNPDRVSWFAPHLETSLRLLKRAGLEKDSSLIDVGGGASTLVDDLLALGCAHVTVLDISAQALEVSKARLGARAAEVAWIAGDITAVALPPRAYDFWHDRAVYHFLTSADDRRQYGRAMAAALRPGAHVVMATFAPEGPLRCSGLEVCRYDPASLAAELGPDFELCESGQELHQTPSGSAQQFQYSLFRWNGAAL